jgi:hypothetical protein
MWWAKAVQVTGLTAGSLQLEGTIDNANWASVGAAITAVGIYTIDTPLAYIRVNAVAASGSSLAVTLFGSR